MEPEDFIDGLAGAGGVFIAQLITYPLQTVNTRQQIERDRNERRIFGTLEQLYQIVEQEGWERLYGGFAPSLVAAAMSQGVYNLFYQTFSNKAEATSLAGCVNVLLTNPIWLVVTRMQTHTRRSQLNRTDLPSPEDVIPSAVEPQHFSTSLTIQEVYSERGVLGFWRGALPSLIMVISPSIQFVLYETLLKRLKTWRPSSSEGDSDVTASEVDNPPMIIYLLFKPFWTKLKQRRLSSIKRKCNVTTPEIFLLETLAKLGATIVTYPLLVVKSRLQAKQTVADERHRYKGTADAIDKMIRYEGWYGFYKGLSTKIVQSVLAAAVPFMLKDKLVKGTEWVLFKAAKLFLEFIVKFDHQS